MRTYLPLSVTALLLTASAPALARSSAWFAKSGEAELPGIVEVPLLRGEHARHLPLVQVEHHHGDRRRAALAVVDLAHSWTTIGYRDAVDWGLTPTETRLNGAYAQVVVLPELHIGDAVLRDIRAQVVPGEGLTLGLAALPVAAAIVPSQGVVRLAPRDQGRALVEAVGEPVATRRQGRGSYKVDGAKQRGNGLALAVEGAMAGQDGWVQLATAAPITRVPASHSERNARERDGEQHVRARGRIGAVELSESWAVRDPGLGDDGPAFVGRLGYDQLYSVDLAVSPADGIAAVTGVMRPQWTSSAEAHLELARAAHQRAGLPTSDERVDRPPPMGFGAATPAPDPSGDPGDDATARLERNLAEALWASGALDEAIPHYLAAAEAAGDRCGPQMELGLRRLAWSGTMQEQGFIIELIRQPLRQAGELWDRWAAQPGKVRDTVLAGGTPPDGAFAVPQQPRCLTAWGTLMAAYVAQGDTAASSAIYREHHGTDPLVAFAQGLSLLHQGRPETAEIPIREALGYDVAESGEFKLGLGWALAQQAQLEPTLDVAREVPGLRLDHGLTAAMIALEWGQLLEGEDGAKAMASRLVQADPYWIPAQLVAAWLEVEEGDANQLGAELVRQHGRYAGAMDIAVYRAVLRALQGDEEGAHQELRSLQRHRPPTPDLFAARALVAHRLGRPDEVAEQLRELRLRFPTLPFRTLSLPTPDAG